MKMRIMILHGPNLNLLGSRETELYGRKTLDDINESLRRRAEELGVEIQENVQTNSESALVEHIQAAQGKVDGIVINPAAYTHTSIALRDALLATGIPFVEVHLSNVHAREPYRHQSYLSDIAVGLVAGFGPDSYLLALEGLIKRLESEEQAG
jgi:3-dehydroquinate dehydratase-2